MRTHPATKVAERVSQWRERTEAETDMSTLATSAYDEELNEDHVQ